MPLGGAAAATIATDTDPTGQFTLRLHSPGRVVLTLSRIGYGTRVDTLDVPEAGLMRLFELRPAAVRVDSVTVEARSRSHINITPPTSKAHLVSGSDLLKLEEMGVSMEQAIRRLPGFRFPQVRFPRYGVRTCVESIRRIVSIRESACSSVVLVIDDVVITDPEDVADELKTLRISEMESIQMIPPTEAQIRFGLEGGARGVIQMYRRGWGPYASPDRNPKKQ